MKKLNFVLLVAVSAIVAGCGGSSATSSDEFKIEKVEYSIENNQITCNKPSSQTISKAQRNDDYGVAFCTWLCGSYEGASPVTVRLTFVQDGKDAPWTFDSDTISTASEMCHN